jgi:hypothetical protein
MSRPSLATLAWSAAAASVALATAGGLVAAVGGADAVSDFVVFFVLVLALIIPAAIVGGLVASRRPANPIGWIFCGFGVFMGLAVLAAGYVEVAPGDATHGLGQAAAWFANWSYVALFALTVFVLLLFPDGRLVSDRWRLAAWGGGVGTIAFAAGTAVEPGRLTDFPEVTNPLGGNAAVSNALQLAGVSLTGLALLAAFASVVVRYRVAGETGRQQIKWLAVAGAFTACCVAVGTTVAVLGAEPVGNSVVLVGILAIPIAIGVAILRHRLYDVDRVISRSLSYALVTITLVGAYAALVLGGQALFSAVTGGSDLAIAVSTLIVAALFLPVRSRMQGLVDRRFYRRRYDAQRTLSAFGARLREQVELDGLRTDLEGVVRDTMQPAHVSLWLPGAPR